MNDIVILVFVQVSIVNSHSCDDAQKFEELLNNSGPVSIADIENETVVKTGGCRSYCHDD